jgi:hypothetical protein
MVAMPAMVAGQGPASGGVTAPAGTLQPGVSVVLTAAREPQARILNPGPPTGLSATAGNGQVTLSWNAPASDGGAAIIGYDVYRGTSAHGESASPVNTGLITGTSYTVSGLKNGTTYYFTADAVNRANLHSGVSAEASATPAAVTTRPGPPNGLTASPGNGKVTLSWTAPGSNGGSAISGYEIYRGTTAGGESGSPVNGSLVAGTSYTVTGLTNGTTYYFAHNCSRSWCALAGPGRAGLGRCGQVIRQVDIGRTRRACLPVPCQGPRVQDQVPWASSRP